MENVKMKLIEKEEKKKVKGGIVFVRGQSCMHCLIKIQNCYSLRATTPCN